ncbi:hypothetical protein C0991_000408 [Blastosporella zonata]|nr:hypothetical protein C0991_000408 [Blastosporella zonata]
MHILSPTTSHPPIIPPPTTVFARLRSGSAPAPINIKAADPKVYFNNINVNTGSNTPNSNEGSGSAQGGFGGLDGVGVHRVEAEGRIEEERSDGEIRRNSTGMEQTFPETPSAFSPGFSIASPRVGAMGTTPMSASFAPPPSSSTMSVFIPSGSPHLGRIGGMGAGPSLAQQVLLTRAATSVHGARHSRQASLGRSVSANGLGGNPVGNGRQVNEKVEEEAEEKEQTQNAPAATKSPFPPKPNPPLFDTPPAPSHPHHHPTHKSPSSTPPQSPPQSPLPDTPPSIQHTHPPPPPPVPRPTPPTHTPLPASIPPPPTSVPPVPPPAPTHAHTQPTHNAPSISTPLKTTPKSNLTPTPNTTPAHTPAAPVLGTVSLPQMTPSPSPPVSVPELEVEVESEAGHNVGHDSNPDHQQELELRHAPDPRNLYLREPDTPSGYGSGSEEAVLAYTSPSPHEFGGGGGWRGSFGGSSEGSPGPQVSPLRDGDVLGDHQTEGVNPNVTANANVPSVMPTTTTTPTPPTRRILPFALPSPVPPSPSSVSISSPVYSPYDALSPPSYYAVIGYDYGAGVGTPSTSGSYDPTFQFGGGSAGELAPSTILAPSTHLTDPSDPYPQFAVPSPKWRGYTMDAAKWTFTSIELQGIVSRAIRASSEASGIRLLKLETLDGEIPREVERLQRAREEAKGHYRDLVRRREGVLGALGGGMGMGQENEERLEELKEVCQALDRTSEELHSADEQLAQLAQLIQGHSASALAMALRKLNASFLKQFAEAQSLRQQVEALAAERDEAWTQAVEVAADYEDLRTGRIVESPDAENRFERVVAVRKLSTRAAKAGLGLRSASGGRSIRRGSISSSRDNFRGFGANTPSSSSARTTMYGNDPPPVPPVPRHRPVDIKTNLPLTRSSTLTGVSTEFPTPSSDTRAMVRAQDELYDMLGIPVNDRARRSRSVIGLPGDAEPVASPSYSYYEAPPNTGRRASLPPPSAALPPDPYALSANSSIIWASDRAGWI